MHKLSCYETLAQLIDICKTVFFSHSLSLLNWLQKHCTWNHFPSINSSSSWTREKTTLLGPILGQYYLDIHSISNTNILTITGSVKYCPIFYKVECGYLTGLWNCFLCHVASLAWWVQSPSGSSLACEAIMTAYHYCLGGSTWSVATWNKFLFVCQWSTPMYPGRLVVPCLNFLVNYRS